MAVFKAPPVVVIDFETHMIVGRPDYPPVPVGVSIQWPRQKPYYYAWAHVNGENNCPKHHADKLLHDVWESQYAVLAHNMKFEMDICETYFDLPRLPWQRYQDTLPLLFLDDPRAHTFQLKPAGERYLHQPPDERDAVADWLITHQPVAGVRITKSTFAKYIAYCPPEIVEPYANGDVQRTFDLFTLLHPVICTRGMQQAYDRERRLLPVLLDMERAGVPVDVERLGSDVFQYNSCLQQLDGWLRKKLKVSESINLDSGDQLAEALIHAGLANAALLGVTKTGKYQTTQDAMERAITNMQVQHALIYRSQLNTCLHTFMEPWLATAQASGGLIYTTWNSVRTPSGQKSVGTRTGRLSSTPNFQNAPKEFQRLFDGKKLPKSPVPLLSLPSIRSYIIPYNGHVLVGRDFSQQELRILAHYAEGILLDTYLRDPWTDFHDFARDMVNTMLHTNFERKPIKNMGFGIIYGMGIGKLARAIEDSVETARKLKNAYLYQLPGVKSLYDEMRRRAKCNEPIRTWGGREYYVEEPEIVNGQIRTYDYKLVNLLIQGSAGDCTKEAMIQYHENLPSEWYMFLTVHDELLTSVPLEDFHDGMEHLRQAMEYPQFDIAMLSEGYFSFDNWYALQAYDKAGQRVYEEFLA